MGNSRPLVLVAMGLSLFLTGCGEINSSMADSMIDRIPHWAGGLPADAPPRATDPKYHDYVEKLEGKSAAEAPKTDAGAATQQPEPKQ